uniref:NBS-LRR protein n=2 Tax=Triticum urartu TaxID=4572 RepID=A0A8R7TM50_TRIUA
SLEKLIILDRPDLLSSLVHTNGRWLLPNSLGELESNDHSQGTLQLCFPRDITSLKKLTVCFSKDLQSLQLHSCTALEELKIRGCGSLTALQGLQFLGSLRHLTVYNCPGLPPFLESFSRQGYTLLPRLKRLDIQDPFILTTSFCRHLTSLQHLKLTWLEEVGLTDEQEQVLVLLESLQVL